MTLQQNRMDLSVDMAFIEFFDRCEKNENEVVKTMIEELLGLEGEERFDAFEEILFHSVGESITERMSRMYFRATRYTGEKLDIQFRFMNSLDDISRSSVCISDLGHERYFNIPRDTTYMLFNVIHKPGLDSEDQEDFMLKTVFEKEEPDIPLSRDFHLVSISLPFFRKMVQKGEIKFQEDKRAKWALLLAAVNPRTRVVNTKSLKLLEKLANSSPVLNEALESWKDMLDDEVLVFRYEKRYKKLDSLHKAEASEYEKIKAMVFQSNGR